MSQRKLQHEIDKENHRQSRIDVQLATMPPHQLKRLEVAQRSLELGLARVYGNRLHAGIAARIVAGLVLNPECLNSIGGGLQELPSNPGGWDRLARTLVTQEPLGQLSIDHNDSALRSNLRADALEAIKPQDRLAKARAGTLDTYLEDVISTQLEARAGL